MQQLPPQFLQAKQKNLGFGVTYGAHRSVHAPHWTGDEGDLVAQTRMAWPTATVQKYFNGPQYNQLSKTLLQTALQGEARSMASAKKLVGQDDYTPQLGRTKLAQASEYPRMQKIDDDDSSSMNEVILVTVVILGIVGMLFIIGRD